MNETNHPARRLRHGDRPTEPPTFDDAAANKAAEEGEQFVAMAARIFEFKPHKQQPEHKAKYVQFALEAIAADRAARPVAEKLVCGFCKGTGDGEIGLSGCTDCNGKGYFWEPIEDNVSARPVANKAPHDIWGSEGEFAEFYGAGFEGRYICPTTRGNALAAYDNGIKARAANKAEVEESEHYRSGYMDGMEEGARLALSSDSASSTIPEGWPTEIWLNAGDEELAPFSEYDELSWCSLPQGENDIRYVREDLLATPPATTGASVRTLDSLPDLMDEWVEAARGPNALAVYAKIEALIDQHVAREVAAKAGQVAVPDFRNVTQVKRISDQSLTITFASCASCSKFERAAAPSPAKESK